MSLAAYNKKIIVYDKTNYGIVCSADSDSHAAALCLAQVNLTWTSLAHVNALDIKMHTANYDSNDKHYQLMTFAKKFEIQVLPAELATTGWYLFRELMFVKARYLRELELSLRIIKRRVCTFYAMDSIMPYVFSILGRSDPERDYYDSAIVEYASIQGIEPIAAYNELTMYAENYGLVHLRNHAHFMTHSKNIAMATTAEQVREMYDSAIKDIM